MKARTNVARFGIFVYDGVEPIDVGATVGVLSMAKRVLPHVEVLLVAETAGVVKLANGMRVLADYDCASCPEIDALVVCGGPGWSVEVHKASTLHFIRHAPTSLLASVCTGGMILAAAGRLDGFSATTRRMAVGDEAESPLDLMRRRYPAIRAIEARVVDCGGVVTGGGVSLAMDTTLHLLERLYGEDAAAEVARIIEYSDAWQANKKCL